jgi:tetratricopeptide (TPR) repeat protein
MSFDQVLRGHLDNAKSTHGLTQVDIARSANIDPSLLSHYARGKRLPTQRRIVLELARGMRLGRAATDELLVSGEFSPADESEVPAEGALQEANRKDLEEAAANVRRIDRRLLGNAIDQNVVAVNGAWHHYFEMADNLIERNWPKVIAQFEQGIATHYWRLRQASDRYLAYLYLAKAAATEHTGDLSDAAQACRRGLEAAHSAKDRSIECELLIRLADIEKLRGRFNRARGYYAQARALADGLDTGSAQSDRGADSEWREYQRARINRKLGNLNLFEGNPYRALSELRAALDHFVSTDDRYQVALVNYSMGWAHSLIGQWDVALKHHTVGFTYFNSQGKTDNHRLLQGLLYIGGDYLTKGDIDKARYHLLQAKSIAEDGDEWMNHHEVGRVYLLLGKVHCTLNMLEIAEDYIMKGIDFYRRKQDPVRLAGAYNLYGEFYLQRNRVGDGEAALQAFGTARDMAASVDPPNHHYKAAAMVNQLSTRLALHHMVGIEAGSPGIDLAVDLWRAIQETERHCGPATEENHADSKHEYHQHLARLKVVEAQLLARLTDEAWNEVEPKLPSIGGPLGDHVDDGQKGTGISRVSYLLAAAGQALSHAYRFNPTLVNSTNAALMQLPCVEHEQRLLYERMLRVIEQMLFTGEDLIDSYAELRRSLREALLSLRGPIETGN